MTVVVMRTRPVPAHLARRAERQSASSWCRLLAEHAAVGGSMISYANVCSVPPWGFQGRALPGQRRGAASPAAPAARARPAMGTHRARGPAGARSAPCWWARHVWRYKRWTRRGEGGSAPGVELARTAGGLAGCAVGCGGCCRFAELAADAARGPGSCVGARTKPCGAHGGGGGAHAGARARCRRRAPAACLVPHHCSCQR